MHLTPPDHLADTASRLRLNYNGLAGADTSKACHVFTCTQKPCQGASFDVPEDATADQLDDAYIAKRDQFIVQVNADLLKACEWIQDALCQPNGGQLSLMLNKFPGWVEWYDSMSEAVSEATKK